MAAIVTQPDHSFVRFGADYHETCNDNDVIFNLPMVYHDDVAFQFIIQTDTDAEADELTSVGSPAVRVGITSQDPAIAAWLKDYTATQPERFRIGPRRVLYQWDAGAPDFESVVAIGKCFRFVVTVTISTGTITGISNKFERIASDCYNTLLEYSADKNQFGFVYCGYYDESDGGSIPVPANQCDPMVIPFNNKPVMVIPYTAAMLSKYGDVPRVDVYIYNPQNGLFELVPGISASLDNVPPTVITVDLGGPATGYIKIT
jgi:hypothetical protein